MLSPSYGSNEVLMGGRGAVGAKSPELGVRRSGLQPLLAHEAFASPSWVTWGQNVHLTASLLGYQETWNQSP